jgi:hypothetical protein
MAASKYGKYIYRKPLGKGPQPRKVEEQSISFGPEVIADMKEFDINFNFVGKLAPHQLGDPPHKHDCDELLFFIPGDPSIAPYLGGEMEIGLGDEWEKQTINTAAIICIPAGLTHCPVFVKKVEVPFYFGHCLLASSYGSSVNPAEENKKKKK